jgi:hypothetical protein
MGNIMEEALLIADAHWLPAYRCYQMSSPKASAKHQTVHLIVEEVSLKPVVV